MLPAVQKVQVEVPMIFEMEEVEAAKAVESTANIYIQRAAQSKKNGGPDH